ncbi:hypothetical protein EDC61_11536 [Sulfuritortus calidifontis]|uniref:Crp/Fnr family transcriptional regulator n=1 Tax=Sulfuritortus calidifontis TaxID=1914471 RepID=A0A4R3JT69_9PROT|nr:hypothetical protein [Sulfuritortus calidifontis]TCS70569.1 hypothetical protein EDC61_11536 [Sulfuritortus calidifontis]
MTQDERRLLRLFRSLSESQRTSLVDFAEFLTSRASEGAAPSQPQTPLDIPRPTEESLIQAIKRLKATYPMLAGDKLLHETSALVTQHILHKRPAAEVIDELEAMFRRQYENHSHGE